MQPIQPYAQHPVNRINEARLNDERLNQPDHGTPPLLQVDSSVLAQIAKYATGGNNPDEARQNATNFKKVCQLTNIAAESVLH
jgi:hypothetical protein